MLAAAKLDRLSRSERDFAQLLDRAERGGWAVVVLDVDVDTTTAAGRLVVDVVNTAAAFESRRIGERVKAAHALRKSQGRGANLRHHHRLPERRRRPDCHGGHLVATVRHLVESASLDRELAAVKA